MDVEVQLICDIIVPDKITTMGKIIVPDGKILTIFEGGSFHNSMGDKLYNTSDGNTISAGFELDADAESGVKTLPQVDYKRVFEEV